MQILVNGAPRELADGHTVAQLLVELGCAPEGVAVAVNLVVVPRSQRANHTLTPGDRVEIIQALGGG